MKCQKKVVTVYSENITVKHLNIGLVALVKPQFVSLTVGENVHIYMR